MTTVRNDLLSEELQVPTRCVCELVATVFQKRATCRWGNILRDSLVVSMKFPNLDWHTKQIQAPPLADPNGCFYNLKLNFNFHLQVTLRKQSIIIFDSKKIFQIEPTHTLNKQWRGRLLSHTQHFHTLSTQLRCQNENNLKLRQQ